MIIYVCGKCGEIRNRERCRFFLSTGFSAFSTFFSTGLLRGDGGCRPVDVKAFKACGGLMCLELCTACGKKWACFFAGIG